MRVEHGVLVLACVAGCVAVEPRRDGGNHDQGRQSDFGVAMDLGPAELGPTADAGRTPDGSTRPTDGSVCVPEPRLWNGSQLSPIQAGSFCDNVTFGVSSSDGVVDAVEGISERIHCTANETTTTCVFWTDPNDPHLTLADMEILCAAEDAEPELDWSCTDAT